MHLCNGMMFSEIAYAVNRSEANVKYHSNQARMKCGVKTLPQLTAVAVGCGLLHWDADKRTVLLRPVVSLD